MERQGPVILYISSALSFVGSFSSSIAHETDTAAVLTRLFGPTAAAVGKYPADFRTCDKCFFEARTAFVASDVDLFLFVRD